MSKTVQFKRGNANVSATYVGAQGEITVNTDNYTLNVHDGVRAGGYTILNANVSNIGNLSVTNQTIIGTSANTNITLSPNNANVVLTSNLVTPNIAINRYTVQSVNSGSSLTLPAQSDSANIDLNNTFSNIRFTTYDPTTNVPYTLVLNRDGDVVFPGYLKSSLGSAEIQFAGGQGLLMYANFDTGSTGISLNDTGTSDIFANVDLRLTTNYAGAGKQWLFGSNGTLTTTGNLSTANLSISHAVANNTVQVRTLANSDLKLVATDGTYQSAIYLWANNQRMSFNTVSNAFDFNFNGQLSATDFTASKNSNVGYSFYAEGSGYSGFRHSSGPPDVITIVHEGNVFAGFYGNYTTQLYGNLVVSGDGETFGSFPDAYVQVYSNVDTYSQFVLQNINDGSDASTDVVVTADNGNDSTYYINMGILGSNHAAADFFGDTRNYDDGYLIVVGNDSTGGAANVGNLIIGSTNGIVKTFVGNVAEANVVTTVSESLLTVAGNIIPAANVTYGLGTETNQWKDLWLSNTTLYMGGTAITVVDGTLSVGGNVIGGGGSNYGNSNVAAYLTVYNGSILTNTVNFSDSTVQTTAWKAGGNSAFTSNSVFVNNVSAGDFNNNGDFTVTFDAYTGGPSLNFSANYQSPLNSNVGITVQAVNTPIIMSNGNIELRANLSTAWTFDSTGDLTLPGSLSTPSNITVNDTLFVVGSIQPTGASPAPYLSGFSSISTVISGNANEGNITAHNYLRANGGIITTGNITGGNLLTTGLISTTGNVAADTVTALLGNITNINSLNLSVENISALVGNNGVNISAGGNNNIIVYPTYVLVQNVPLSVQGNVDAGNLNATGANLIGNITGGNLFISGNITGNTAGFAIGYRDIPQVVFTSNATLALTDAGKHYYSANSANIITVPNNATVSFNIGTAISIVQQGTANLTVTPASGVTMYLAGNSTSASRTFGNYGMATLMKVDTDTWFINGTGLT